MFEMNRLMLSVVVGIVVLGSVGFTNVVFGYTLEAKIVPSDGAAGDLFGIAVSIDGDKAIASSSGDTVNGPDSGSAYIFEKNPDCDVCVMPIKLQREILLVADKGGHQASVFNLTFDQHLGTIPLFDPPSGCTLSKDTPIDIEIIGEYGFVTVPGLPDSTCENNQIAVIDIPNARLIQMISTDRGPAALDYYEGNLYVLNSVENTIQKINLNDFSIQQVIDLTADHLGHLYIGTYSIGPETFEIANDIVHFVYYLPAPPYASIEAVNLDTTYEGLVFADRTIAEPNTSSCNFHQNYVDDDGTNRPSPSLDALRTMKQLASDKIYVAGDGIIAVFDPTTEFGPGYPDQKLLTACIDAFYVSPKSKFTVIDDHVFVANPLVSPMITTIDLNTHEILGPTEVPFSSPLLGPTDIESINDNLYVINNIYFAPEDIDRIFPLTRPQVIEIDTRVINFDILPVSINLASGRTIDFDELDYAVAIDVYDPSQSSITSTSLEIRIPAWMKNNAGWWASGLISDSDFVLTLEHLIQEKIIVIPYELEKISSEKTSIPEWVKLNAKWWSEGIISDKEFALGLEYLIGIGVIRI